MLETSIKNKDVTYGGGVSVSSGPSFGVSLGYTPTPIGYGIVTYTVNAGFGLPSGKVAVGISNTYMLKDFKK